MARRPATIPSREIYAERLRRLIEVYGSAAPGSCPWPAQLAAIERGEVVEVHGYLAGLGAGRWQLRVDGAALLIRNSKSAEVQLPT